MSQASSLRYLPLRAGTNNPIISEWQKRATSDRDVIQGWRHEFPNCNFGILTGNGVGVIDIDCKPNADEPWSFQGFTSFIDMEESLGVDLRNLPLVQTASGAHLYFRYESELPSKVPWLPHVDIKADGGHQVASPGTVRTVAGRERVYALLRGSLEDIPLAPAELLQAIRQWRTPKVGRPGGTGGNGSGAEWPKTDWLREHGFRHGERDPGFHALAWRLVRTHYPHMDLVRQVAYEVWLKTDQGNDPFPWAAVEQKIERAEAALVPRIHEELAWAKNIRSIQ